ncbi:DUF4381 domain-containing protein [Motiliproteus sediminis]|uniref:DUF4381 domain-containing protein n=1 Tax=Motiliproteus sediminis TaxID=1468178 RepID=UPI001AEF6C9D|nr:DUF4381 domain-containing protein [Motiliproteus sediminis]
MNPASTSLEQLRDIHLPPAIGYWPPAPGWWLLALIALAALAAGCWWGWRRYQQRRYRREALRLLAEYRHRFERDHDLPALLAALSALLRRTALSAYPAAQVAGLTGNDWRDFLRQHSGLAEFDTSVGEALIRGPYQPQPKGTDHCDANALLHLTERWIKAHRRPSC